MPPNEDVCTTVRLKGYCIEIDSVGFLSDKGNRIGYYTLGFYDELPIFEEKVRKKEPSKNGLKNDPRPIELHKKAERLFNSSCKGKKSYRKSNYSKDLVEKILPRIHDKDIRLILEKARSIINQK